MQNLHLKTEKGSGNDGTSELILYRTELTHLLTPISFHRRELNEDPDEALSNLKHNVDNVKLFLDSIVHDGIARKNPGLPVDDLLESEAEGSSEPETPKKLMYKSTVDQIYKYLQMCYFQHTGEKMLPRHNAEIHNVCIFRT
jgi:hypothetical protein